MRWVVVGATGLIGRALCGYLSDEGHTVVAVSRSGDSVPGATSVRWDPAAGAPRGFLDGADVLVNLAGAGIGDSRWTEERKRLIISSRVDTTTALVAALADEATPRVLVNASAVGFYGTGEDAVTETSPAGDDFLAQTCARWEEAARTAEAHGVRVALTRFGIVLASGGGALERQLPLFRAGLGGPIAGGRQWMSWVHIDDVVRIITLAGTAEISGPINVVAPNAVRQKEFAKSLGAALHRPAILPAPGFALRMALGEMATLAVDGQHVVPQVATAAGYSFRYPEIAEALRAVV